MFVPALVSHVEMSWEMPAPSHVLRRLGSFARVVHFDKRGTGLSDRTAGLPTLEERADDVRAVMDAAGVERAALYAPSEGGQTAMYFAATHPDRVTHLVLPNTSSGAALYDEEERATALAAFDNFIAAVEEFWGQGVVMQMLAGDTADAVDVAQAARFERNSATPNAAADVLRRTLIGDATAILPLISAPTLVISRRDDPVVPRDSGGRLAAAIPGARHVELPGAFHMTARAALADDALDAAEEFLTGNRPAEAAERVLATILFTDIVDSTAQAAALRDAKWRSLLDSHDAAVRREIDRFRGREVKTTGDGFLATFDGPARAVRCAQSVIEHAGALGIQIRSGVHTGEIELRGHDVAGLGVHIASRVAGLAGAGEVLVSSTVRDLTAGSGLEFDDAGVHQLKGVPGEWQLLRVMA